VGDRITYVGLDVHKDGIVVAVAEDGLRGEVRDYGRIANTPAAWRRLVGKLGSHGVALRFCYEAGPCGYGIQRQLAAAGHDCVCQTASNRDPGSASKKDPSPALGQACPGRYYEEDVGRTKISLCKL
jgi:transposase